MIPIIILTCINAILYIASLSTPWFLWNDSLILGFDDLEFKWNYATYKQTFSQTADKFEYSDNLKKTFTPTLIILLISLGFMVLGPLVSSIVFQFMKSKKNMKRTALYFIISSFLHLLLILLGFFYFLSFMENVKKESQFCGADSTYFQDIVKQNFYSYNTDVNQTYIYTPIFCDGKFYENFYRLNYSRGSCSPGAGYWICIPIIILSLTNIIIYFCHYDHRNIKHSKNCPNDSSNDIKPTGIVLGTMAATKYNTNNGDIQKPVDRDHKRSDSSDSSSSSSSSDEKHEKHHNHHVSNPAQQPLPPPQVYPPPQQHQPYPYQPNVPYHQPPPQGYQPQPYQPPNTNNYYNQQPLPPPNANMHYGVDYSNDKPAYL